MMTADPTMPAPAAMPATPDAMSAGAPSEVCIPLEMLTAQGEGEKPVPPAMGDPVDFTATGTVSRVDGENAYVTLESVNGAPLPEDEAPEAEEPGETDMRGMAAAADNNPENY